LPILRLLCLLTCLLLAACGGTSQQQYAIYNPDAVELTISDETLSLVAGETSVSLPRDEELDRGSFLYADTEGDIENPILVRLAISETDYTFAAILITHDEANSADTFIGRTIALEATPTGSAEISGDYIGTFVSPDNSDLMAYIRGQVTLTMNFDDMIISGRVDNRTTKLYGLPFDFVMNGGLEPITFPEMTIDDTGAFAGSRSGDVGLGEVPVDVSGLIGGASTSEIEAVGTVTSGAEVGIFVVGHPGFTPTETP
jgi:hypothetical protein